MDHEERIKQLRAILLDLRGEFGLGFPGLDQTDENGRVTLKGANLFFLGCINDMAIRSEQAWDNAEFFYYNIVPDKERVWKFIAEEHTFDEWMNKLKEYKLMPIRKDYQRNYRIAQQILEKYEGDPRNIWEKDSSGTGLPPSEIARRLMDKDFRMGIRLTYMVIGALKNYGIVQGASDVKADVNITRVLGRIIEGRTITPDEATTYAREIYPEDPWEIDEPLFIIGKEICRARKPLCDSCGLFSLCKYKERSVQ